MITLSVPLRNSRLAVIGHALDASVQGGLLHLYTAPRPAVGEPLSSQTLLAEIRLPKPSVASLDGGVLAFAPVDEALCHRTGTAAWARMLDGNATGLIDLDVGEIGSGAEVELDNLNLLAGGRVRVQLGEIRE
jgi:hypothetical protein